MTDSVRTALQRSRDRLPEAPVHPLVASAMERDPSAETLEKLLDLQARWEAEQARKAYTAALVALKRDPEFPRVLRRDTLVTIEPRDKPAYSFKHTSLASGVEQLDPVLQRYGFAHNWVPATPSPREVTVTCRLTHEGGHFEETTLTAPPDPRLSDSSAVCSTITRLSRYSLFALLGVATADQVEDERGVNWERNLRAVASLSQAGVSLEEAERIAGAPVMKWTAAHLDVLREEHHRRKRAAAPTTSEPSDEATREDVDALFAELKPHEPDFDDESQTLFQEASLAYDDQDYETAADRLRTIQAIRQVTE